LNRDEGLIGPAFQEASADAVVGRRYFLDVRSTFKKADLFVSEAGRKNARRQLRRFVELLFGHPFHTPTRDEMGMAYAYAASVRTADLSRHVGAAITTKDGEVLAVGTNEVPKSGGGLYWSGDQGDDRDFVRGYDSSERLRRELLTDLLRRLGSDLSWLSPAFEDSPELLELLADRFAALGPDRATASALESPLVLDARLLDVIEFGRTVHAEMAALSAAARNGIRVQDATLYCTTFPCHECARHIVAAGISRVVYIEPYPKSRVAELFEDSIGLGHEASELGDRVRFEPFVGVSPKRFFDIFSWVPRKKSVVEPAAALSGEIVSWSLAQGDIRPAIVDLEQASANRLARVSLENWFAGGFRAQLERVERTWPEEPNV
jgi:cytidine deaminase